MKKNTKENLNSLIGTPLFPLKNEKNNLSISQISLKKDNNNPIKEVQILDLSLNNKINKNLNKTAIILNSRKVDS